jgi:hypothetical protein
MSREIGFSRLGRFESPTQKLSRSGAVGSASESSGSFVVYTEGEIPPCGSLMRTGNAARRLHVNDAPHCVSTKKALASYRQFNALRLDGFCVRQLDYSDGKFFEFRQFRRSQATCPGYNLGHSVLTITLANTLRHREVAQAKSTSIAAPPNHPVRPRNHQVVLLSLPGVHPWPGLWAGDIYPAHTRIVDQFLELARC